MIKWGRRRRKKQQLPSSPRPSLLSSWLLRLKKMSGGSNGGGDYKDVGKNNKVAAPVEAAVAPCCRSRSSNHHNSSSSTTAQREEFYGGDEAFWRLSFRKEKIYGGYETEEEGDEKREVMNNFSEMVSGIRRMKELQKITTSADAERVKSREFKSTTTTTPRRRRRRRKKVKDEDDYVICGGGGEFSDCGEKERRKSVYVNRGSPKRRARVRVVVSPRVGAVKKAKEKGGLERFAVVKCSSDPERDFRESMVEMILEMNISGAQQLEDLLACYLALNADDYHHLIINVFRQIWFDLNCTFPPP